MAEAKLPLMSASYAALAVFTRMEPLGENREQSWHVLASLVLVGAANDMAEAGELYKIGLKFPETISNHPHYQEAMTVLRALRKHIDKAELEEAINMARLCGLMKSSDSLN